MAVQLSFCPMLHPGIDLEADFLCREEASGLCTIPSKVAEPRWLRRLEGSEVRRILQIRLGFGSHENCTEGNDENRDAFGDR